MHSWSSLVLKLLPAYRLSLLLRPSFLRHILFLPTHSRTVSTPVQVCCCSLGRLKQWAGQSWEGTECWKQAQTSERLSSSTAVPTSAALVLTLCRSLLVRTSVCLPWCKQRRELSVNACTWISGRQSWLDMCTVERQVFIPKDKAASLMPESTKGWAGRA